MAVDPGGQLRPIVITGPMGIGKTTLGVEVAARLFRRYRDSDADIVRLYGRPGGDIADEHGVAYLHEIERAVLLGALADPEPTVISAAASVVESPAVRRALHHRAYVIVLEAPIDLVLARQAADTSGHRRSMGRAELLALSDRRGPLFSEVADLRLDARLDLMVLADEVPMLPPTAESP